MAAIDDIKKYKRKKTGGRKNGTPNVLSRNAKEAFESAFQAVGGADGLAEWAKKNRTDFYRLYGRLIPVDANIIVSPHEQALSELA